MTDLLFHHYDASPFSEKIRVVFGIKNLAWRSVQQPHMMPKPQLLPLTGGYRRIPVLQIGADIYCDSQLIARVLERLHPTPTSYPGDSEGVCHGLAFWADRSVFLAAVSVVFGKIGAAVPKEFIEDRTKLMGGNVDFQTLMQGASSAADQLRAHAQWIDLQLGDGRPFLLGDRPSLADAAAYHPVWFVRTLPPTKDTFSEFPRLEAWAERVKALGHGRRSDCAPDEALRIAREARPATATQKDLRDPNGLEPGLKVRVLPDDYGFDPVEGELVASSAQDVALRRSAPEVGEVVVHFPRAGYRLLRV
jgi:glutathione S-transferase